MEESKYLEELEADVDVELGQSPRYSTIPASPPSYFSAQLLSPTPSHPQTQRDPIALPTCMLPAHIRPSSQIYHQNNDWAFPSQEQEGWTERVQEKGLRSRVRSRIRGAIRRLLKIMVALLIIVALAIALGLILLRIKDA